MKVLTTVTALSLLTMSNLTYACPPAPEPIHAPPDGATASQAEINAYISAWKEYDAAMARTIFCLADQKACDDPGCVTSQLSRMEAHALLARQLKEAERANEQIRIYKARK